MYSNYNISIQKQFSNSIPSVAIIRKISEIEKCVLCIKLKPY